MERGWNKFLQSLVTTMALCDENPIDEHKPVEGGPEMIGVLVDIVFQVNDIGHGIFIFRAGGMELHRLAEIPFCLLEMIFRLKRNHGVLLRQEKIDGFPDPFNFFFAVHVFQELSQPQMGMGQKTKAYHIIHSIYIEYADDQKQGIDIIDG